MLLDELSAFGATTLCPNNQQTQIGGNAAQPCNVSGCDHGTHVSGIAAGNGATFSGVARDGDIMGIQVFSKFTGAVCSDFGIPSPCILSFISDQISALEHVHSQRNNFDIAAVNMSLGGGGFTSACDNEPQKAAIDLLRSVGIATIVASGNNGFVNAISSPACISTAISVGATTDGDAVASFTNSAQILDLLAPGVSVNSSIDGGGFASFSGTSMATPHVAGRMRCYARERPMRRWSRF